MGRQPDRKVRLSAVVGGGEMALGGGCCRVVVEVALWGGCEGWVVVEVALWGGCGVVLGGGCCGVCG